MPRANYKHSQETKDKISKSNTGKVFPYKPRPSMLGKIPWNKGLTKRYHKQHNDESRRWSNNNPERRTEQALRSTLKQKYGMTLEDYRQLEKIQGGKCAICKNIPTPRVDKTGRSRARLDVDHCHLTNTNRALLCDTCNRGLGQIKESLQNLKNAVAYLEHWDIICEQI